MDILHIFEPLTVKYIIDFYTNNNKTLVELLIDFVLQEKIKFIQNISYLFSAVENCKIGTS